MKTLVIALVLAISLTFGGASRADHTTHPELVRAIREHAELLRQDAAIYQRKRALSHVAHIVEDAKKLRKAMAVHSCLKADVVAIQKAVSDLSAASITADVPKTDDAVKRLSSLSDRILKKCCKEDALSQ